MKRIFFALVLATTSAYGSAILVTNASLMNTSHDVVLWSQLGSDQSYVSQSFFAGSTMNDAISGHLDNGAGSVMMAGMDWKTGGGIVANDALLSSDSGTGGGGPVNFNMMMPVYGAGAFIQADGFAQFTARIQAFSGMNSVLDMTVTSDAAGDAVFLGISDTMQEITRIVYSLTAAPVGFSTNDFVLDKLYIGPALAAPPAGTVAPEPGTASILALSLLALGFKMKQRSATV